MSSKKDNQNKQDNLNNSVNVNNLKLIEYSEFNKLSRYFSQTRAKRNFFSIFGATILLIAAIPALLMAFYLFVVSLLSVLNAYEVLNPQSFIIMDKFFITIWNQIISDLMVNFDHTSWLQFLTIASIGTLGNYYNFSSIIFLIFGTLIMILTSSIFLKTFSVLLGKANHRSSAIFGNLFVSIPLFLLASLFIYTGVNLGGLTWNLPSHFLKIMLWSSLGIVILGILPLMFGKYKLSVAVSY